MGASVEAEPRGIVSAPPSARSAPLIPANARSPPVLPPTSPLDLIPPRMNGPGTQGACSPFKRRPRRGELGWRGGPRFPRPPPAVWQFRDRGFVGSPRPRWSCRSRAPRGPALLTAVAAKTPRRARERDGDRGDVRSRRSGGQPGALRSCAEEQDRGRAREPLLAHFPGRPGPCFTA